MFSKFIYQDQILDLFVMCIISQINLFEFRELVLYPFVMFDEYVRIVYHIWHIIEGWISSSKKICLEKRRMFRLSK